MWNKTERKGKVDQAKGKVKQAVGTLTQGLTRRTIRDVALLLPFPCSKVRQRAAEAGTRRNHAIG